MSSDASYGNFLEQANQDTGADKAKTQAKGKGGGNVQLKTVDTEVPKALQGVDKHYYVSEADEPFEAVALNWDGEGEIDEGMYVSIRLWVLCRALRFGVSFEVCAGGTLAEKTEGVPALWMLERRCADWGL